MASSDVDGVVGGVTQVRAVTTALTAAAKSSGVAMVLVGHVTKEGAIAGLRSLEHLVDVVLHFEGDRNTAIRMVRGIKNRFGAADEVGCFMLQDKGIACVADPSGLFLDERPEPVPGTAVTVTLDGKRPLIGEIQALLAKPANPAAPRRAAVSGIDYARVSMINAVLENRAKVPVGAMDIFLSTVGGMRLTDPSSDLAVAIAIASAFTTRALPSTLVVIGEIGLAGDLRRVTGMDRRLAEAARLGFTTALIPAGGGAAPGVARRGVTTPGCASAWAGAGWAQDRTTGGGAATEAHSGQSRVALAGASPPSPGFTSSCITPAPEQTRAKVLGWASGAAMATPVTNTNQTSTRRASRVALRKDCRVDMGRNYGT
jgi:DNA repair protein RadA/Sms